MAKSHKFSGTPPDAMDPQPDALKPAPGPHS